MICLFFYTVASVSPLGWSELGRTVRIPRLCFNANIGNICSYRDKLHGREILRPLTASPPPIPALFSQRTGPSRFVDPVLCEVFFSHSPATLMSDLSSCRDEVSRGSLDPCAHCSRKWVCFTYCHESLPGMALRALFCFYVLSPLPVIFFSVNPVMEVAGALLA